MQDKLDEIFNDRLKEIEPLLRKIEDEKTNLIVIKKFTESMCNREKSEETKFIFREIIDYVDSAIKELSCVENELSDKVKSVAMAISTNIVRLVTHEISKEISKELAMQIQNELKRTNE